MNFGGYMNNTIKSIQLAGIVLLLSTWLSADPVVRKITNTTPFLWRVVISNDVSDCNQLQGRHAHDTKTVEIKPFSVYEKPFLLGFAKPGLVLRPVAFFDEKNNKLYPFVNDDNLINKNQLQDAYHAWKKTRGRWGASYSKNAHEWLSEWLCGDFSLMHNHIEIFGYCLNTAIVRAENNNNFKTCMIDYSEGLFSKLNLEITITQTARRGIKPIVKSFVGQGALCQDGHVVFI